jgi:hypothetical protein
MTDFYPTGVGPMPVELEDAADRTTSPPRTSHVWRVTRSGCGSIDLLDGA